MIEALIEALTALETAKSGLEWYQDRNPGQRDGSDDEAMAQIDAAIANVTKAIDLHKRKRVESTYLS